MADNMIYKFLTLAQQRTGAKWERMNQEEQYAWACLEVVDGFDKGWMPTANCDVRALINDLREEIFGISELEVIE